MRPPSRSPADSTSDSTADSTADLLDRSATGDEASFARLYDETSSCIYGLVLRIVRDPVVAERVTREVYLHAWLNAASHRGRSATAASWLRASAHRRAVDNVRGGERQGPAATAATAATAAEAGLGGAPSERPAPGSPGSPGSARTRLALDGLPTMERDAVELAYFGGYTHQEVSRMVDTGVGSGQALIRVGLQRLSRELQSS